MTTDEDLATKSFEQLVEQLELITRRMAAGDIGIEAVADLYEEAGRLHHEASARLERVRERIEVLADGSASTGPGTTATG